MKPRNFRQYYLLALLLVGLASAYPLYMGFRVVWDSIAYGSIPAANFPKYVIPYTPISLALLLGTVLMPLFFRYGRRFALPAASVLCLAVFLASELLLEHGVTVSTKELVPLESWQLALCYVPPEMYQTRVWEAVDVLLGGYSPWFKLHFYAISVVLIVSMLNSLYGFGHMVRTGDTARKKPLITQTVFSLLFLGLCIWACFTSFYRTGELYVSPVSSILMCVFFLIFGLTMGLYTGTLLHGKGTFLSVVLPSFIAAAVTVIMYIGELLLLSGHLYRFGTGILFRGLGELVLAPVDILVILLSGLLCALILRKTGKGA